MLKGKKFLMWIILIAAVVAVLFLVVACKTFFVNYVSIRGQHLNAFRYGSGGGMEGGYYQKTVKKYDDRALISIESAQWHSQDPTVTEYLTNVSVLDELEAVVRKYKMNFWNRKKFTNEFISDGESESYHFDFDDADISFSSQIYPMRYRNKLSALETVIDKYIESGERLPGLVNTKTDEEENYFLPEDKLEIYVYSYVKDSLGLRILNGTNENIEIPETYKLINVETDEILLEEETPYSGIFSERSRDEMNIKLKERLLAGNYKLVFGGHDVFFEIR